jgi:hypothetical protein
VSREMVRKWRVRFMDGSTSARPARPRRHRPGNSSESDSLVQIIA